MQNTNSWDVIVIGSGLGGLTAAAYSAAIGQKTLLIERYSVMGGSSHVFRRRPNWEFDCGVHYIGDCAEGGELPNLLRGLALEDKISFLPLDNENGFDIVRGPDLEVKIPQGWSHYLDNLIREFPNEERGLRRFMGVVSKIGKSIDIGRLMSTPKDRNQFLRSCGVAATWVFLPLPTLFAACGLSAKASLVLSVQCGALATSPTSMPVGVYAGFLRHYVGEGAWYPKGGGQMFAAGFLDVLITHGGKVLSDTQVEKIIIDAGQVTGVKLDGGEILSTKAVISNADIKRTYRDLVGFAHLPSRLVHKVKKWEMSWPLVNNFFGVELDLTNTPNANFFAIPNWNMTKSMPHLLTATGRLLNFASHRDPVKWAKDFALNQPAYLQSSTLRDPSNRHSAPAGHAAIEVQTITPYSPKLWGITQQEIDSGDYQDNRTYKEIKQIVSDGLADRMEQIYTGSKARIKINEFGTPATQTRFVHTSGGSAFGLSVKATQFGPFRPNNHTPIRGLYLAGCSTTWGPGTLGSMVSGLFAAGAVVGRDLHAEVRSGKVLADPLKLSQWGLDFDPLKASIKMARKNQPVTR